MKLFSKILRLFAMHTYSHEKIQLDLNAQKKNLGHCLN